MSSMAMASSLTPYQVADVMEMYRKSIPWLYLILLLLWLYSTFSWSIATFTNRRLRQTRSYLQLMLASVPLFKALQLMQLLVFWYSCTNFQICTIWTPGVYVTGVIFQAASVGSFWLISQRYYFMLEYLPQSFRPSFDVSVFITYAYIDGFKIGVPYCMIFCYLCLMLIVWTFVFYGLGYPRQSSPGAEDVNARHIATSKYKKFIYALVTGSMVEIPVDMFVGKTPENLFYHLLVREGVQLCVLLYIGSIFRIPDLSRPSAPLTYTAEMDAADYSNLRSQESHIGEATSVGNRSFGSSPVVLVQHPHASDHHQG